MPFSGRDITDGDEDLLVSVLKEGMSPDERHTWEHMADKARQLHADAALTPSQWKGFYLLNEDRIQALVALPPRRGLIKRLPSENDTLLSEAAFDFTSLGTGSNNGNTSVFGTSNGTSNDGNNLIVSSTPGRVIPNHGHGPSPGHVSGPSTSALESPTNFAHSNSYRTRRYSILSDDSSSSANKRMRKQRVEFGPSDIRTIATYLSRFPRYERDTSSHFKALVADNPNIRQLPDSCRRFYHRKSNRERIDKLADELGGFTYHDDANFGSTENINNNNLNNNANNTNNTNGDSNDQQLQQSEDKKPHNKQKQDQDLKSPTPTPSFANEFHRHDHFATPHPRSTTSGANTPDLSQSRQSDIVVSQQLAPHVDPRISGGVENFVVDDSPSANDTNNLHESLGRDTNSPDISV